MVQLFENEFKKFDRKSSKGNQLKWRKNDIWYKADAVGYEGLSEYICSILINFSNLQEKEFVLYETEELFYKHQRYSGCASRNFLKDGEQLITLERLYKQRTGESLYENMYHLPEPEKRLKYLVNQIELITGISDFGKYMVRLFTLDAFFLNEDRHTHNIAVIEKSDGSFTTAPFFDQGAALLSDTSFDYPFGQDIYMMLSEVKAKTISDDFDIQLDTAEKLYGDGVRFFFSKRDVENALEKEKYYPKEIKNRIRDIIFYQMRKYLYLF